MESVKRKRISYYCCRRLHDDKKWREAELTLAHSLRVQSGLAGRQLSLVAAEPETSGHLVSIVRKQREMGAGAQHKIKQTNKEILILKNFEFICSMCAFCLPACLCTTCLPGAHKGHKRTSDLLDLQLQMVACCHMCAGNRIHFLCKS